MRAYFVFQYISGNPDCLLNYSQICRALYYRGRRREAQHFSASPRNLAYHQILICLRSQTPHSSDCELPPILMVSTGSATLLPLQDFSSLEHINHYCRCVYFDSDSSNTYVCIGRVYLCVCGCLSVSKRDK